MEIIGKILEPFSPYIQLIGSKLPGPIEQVGQKLLGEKCYQVLVHEADFITDPQCLSYGISRAIGVAIVGLSSIVKAPQIIKLINSQSSEGLSFLGYVLETITYVLTLAYSYRSGFPFIAFGETVAITIQNVIISVLILNYKGKSAAASAFVALIATLTYVLVSPSLDVVDYRTLTYLQSLTIPLGLLSKMPQVYANFKNKSTGQLSIFSVVSYLLGSLARVFTTIQEVNDPLILASFVGASVLNLVLFLQVLIYWNNSPQAHAAETVDTVRGLYNQGLKERGASKGRKV